MVELEWPVGGGEWKSEICDPTTKMTQFSDVVASIAGRYNKAGTIGVLGYWSEPPRALRAVELLGAYNGRCQERMRERMG